MKSTAVSNKKNFEWSETIWKMTVFLGTLGTSVIREIWFGIWFRTIPLHILGTISLIIEILLILKVDYRVYLFFKLPLLYPTSLLWHRLYALALVLSPYALWGMSRYFALKQFLEMLTLNFREAGLITNMGRLPIFISDRSLGEGVREIHFYLNGLTFSGFTQAREKLSACFGFVEDIQDQENGTVIIQYSRQPIRTNTTITEIPTLPLPTDFAVGYSRAGLVSSNLVDVPHLLVAGATNSGKSTFLRQFIATLIARNKHIIIQFIDLKHNLEAVAFQMAPQVKAVNSAVGAVDTLEWGAKEVKTRAELLLKNGCEKIEHLLSKPPSQIKWTEDHLSIESIARKIIIVDEAAELFLAGGQTDASQSQRATRAAITIAATGRAVGIHLVIATQRPDKNAIDMKIKTNLIGRLSFHMSDNASSLTVLDNTRAAHLPNKPGRAIWKTGGTMKEVNTLCLSKSDLEAILTKINPVVTSSPDATPKLAEGNDSAPTASNQTPPEHSEG